MPPGTLLGPQAASWVPLHYIFKWSGLIHLHEDTLTTQLQAFYSVLHLVHISPKKHCRMWQNYFLCFVVLPCFSFKMQTISLGDGSSIPRVSILFISGCANFLSSPSDKCLTLDHIQATQCVLILNLWLKVWCWVIIILVSHYVCEMLFQIKNITLSLKRK